MRFLAFILIWVSLGVGAVAATTAYSWSFPQAGEADHFLLGTDEDGQKAYAVLASTAGESATGAPVVEPDTALTPEIVTKLQAESVKPVNRVRVKSFKLSRWTHLPYFAIACVGLLAGAMLTRLNATRAAKLADAEAEQDDALSPENAITQLRAVVAALLDEAPQQPSERQACALITHRLGDAIADYVPPITEQRDRLVARMGLSGYAGLMDVFSAAERAMNRAWSASADQAYDEAMESLERAAERLPVAEDKLTGRAPSLLPLG